MEKYDIWKLTPPEVLSHPCKICHFDVYNNDELCEDCQKEEEKEMKNPIEMIKEEFCSRYGLDPKQIQVEIKLHDIPKVEAEGIAKDYGNKYEGIQNYFMGKTCASVNTKAYDMWIHYLKEEQEADENEFIIE